MYACDAVLDVGTDNEELRDDKFYLVSHAPVVCSLWLKLHMLRWHNAVRHPCCVQGAKKDRIRGEEEMEVVE